MFKEIMGYGLGLGTIGAMINMASENWKIAAFSMALLVIISISIYLVNRSSSTPSVITGKMGAVLILVVSIALMAQVYFSSSTFITMGGTHAYNQLWK